MMIRKIAALPEGVQMPLSTDGFGEARSVQSGSVRTKGNTLSIESSGRFKLFSDAVEYIRIERGEGHIKWKRGEIPFQTGDLLQAERAGEYDFYGAGTFLIVKEQV